jgi:tRNA A-37 threonylcarbamoyl transferase component Bud32
MQRLSLAPERVGQYEIVTLLAEGGMARVYLAVLRGPAGFNKLGVIKQIRPEFAWDKEFITMFLDEARLAARLNHPNIVQTYQVVKDQGAYYLAMEYLEGQPLSEIFQCMSRKNLPIDEHLWILSQVLTGLQYAHTLTDYDGKSLDIVHRDVSPANVFVTYNGDVKLLDFGIAKVSGAIGATRQGTVKGKIGYCAPEQLQGIRPDARADIFSVGVMLWEALAGKRMTRGLTAPAITQARLLGKEPKIRDARPDVDAELAEICDRAMSLNPKDRYASAADLQHDIDRHLEKLPRSAIRAQIADRLQGHFEFERKATRKRIEEQLAVPFETASRPCIPGPAHHDLTTTVENPAVARAVKDHRSWARWMAVAIAVVASGAIGAVASWQWSRLPATAVISSQSPPAPIAIASPPKTVPALAVVPAPSPAPETIRPQAQGLLRQEPPTLTDLAILGSLPRAEDSKGQGLQAARTPVVLRQPATSRTGRVRQDVNRKRSTTRAKAKPSLPQEIVRAESASIPAADFGMTLSHRRERRVSKQIDEKDPYSP